MTGSCEWFRLRRVTSAPLSEQEREQNKLRPDLDVVRRYGELHPDVWVGEYIQSEPPPLRMVVLLSGDELERHTSALRRQLAFPDQLEVRWSPYPLAGLEQIRAEAHEMGKSTAMGGICGSGMRHGKVQLRLWASQESLAALLVERYQGAVDLTVGYLHYPDCQLLKFDGSPMQRVRKESSPLFPDEVTVSSTELLTVKSGHHGNTVLRVHNRSPEDLEICAGGAFVPRIIDHSTHEVVGGYEGGLTFLPIRLQVPGAGKADMPILVATASLVPELGYAIPPGQWAIDLDVEVTGQGRFRIPPLPLTVMAV
jgi:hypothetical protein